MSALDEFLEKHITGCNCRTFTMKVRCNCGRDDMFRK
jgi:hypothetical protein